MSEPNPTFAETFERLRLGRGWTPAEVARQLGVYPTEVSRWRRGLGGISIRNVRKVADLFGVDRVWLEKIAGYPDSNSGDTLDTAGSNEAERQLWRARFDSLMETRVPRGAWKAIAAVIRNSDDAQAYLMLVSAQVHIANWRPREQAHALEQLAVSGMTLKQIGDRLHRSEGWVSRRLRVFADPTLAPYVFTSKMQTSVADELLSVRDLPTRKRLAEAAVKEGWSQDQVKGRVRALRIGLDAIEALVQSVWAAHPRRRGSRSRDQGPANLAPPESSALRVSYA